MLAVFVLVLLGAFALLFYSLASHVSSTTGPAVSKELVVPLVRATLHAQRSGNFWLEIRIPGPDRRYNSGRAIYRPNGIIELANKLEGAIGKADALVGTGTKVTVKIPIAEEVSVELTKGRPRIVLCASSSSHKFRRDFTRKQARRLVDTLRRTPDLAQELIAVLEVDSKPNTSSE